MPGARHRAATPTRCNRRNRQSSRSRDTLQQAQRYFLRPVGGVVEQHNLSVGRPTGLHPHPGLAGRIAIRFFQDLHSRFVAVDHRAFQQPIAHQVQQRLKSSLHWITQRASVCRGISIPCRLSTVSKRCSGKPSIYLVISSMASTLGLAALFDQLSWLVGSDRHAFTTPAAIDLAHMFEHVDLHRHDVELLAGFFADDLLAATASR